jgi:hypothetical protein
MAFASFIPMQTRSSLEKDRSPVGVRFSVQPKKLEWSKIMDPRWRVIEYR